MDEIPELQTSQYVDTERTGTSPDTRLVGSHPYPTGTKI
jgi:hypothetical protein